jgi:hypothetical protein
LAPFRRVYRTPFYSTTWGQAQIFLRQELAVDRRRQKRDPTLSRLEKLLFAVLVTQLKWTEQSIRDHLENVLLLFQPDTLLRWHCELMRKKWTYASSRNRSGHPKTDLDVEALVLRLARENGWGGGKLHGDGRLIWIAGTNAPRIAEIIGSYTVEEFLGYSCATLFEPGTLVLVNGSQSTSDGER